jgi:hypothetical protein
MIDFDDFYYFKDDDYFEPSVKSGEYRDWLIKECFLAVIESADEIVNNAQEYHKEDFYNWTQKFM